MESTFMTLNEYEDKNRKINEILKNIVDYFSIDDNEMETVNQSILDQNLKFVSRLQQIVIPQYNQQVYDVNVNKKKEAGKHQLIIKKNNTSL